MPQIYVVISIILSSILFILMLVTNGLANTLPINGQQTGEISDAYPNLFQPTGLTFSIWGVIYTLLAIFVVTQLVLVFNGSSLLTSKPLFNLHILFSISSLINVSWLFAWHHHRIGMSLFLMVMFLIILAVMYTELHQFDLITQASFKIIFGWISIATIANVTIYLVKLGINYNQSSSIILTFIIFLVGLVIGLYMLFYQQDYFFAGVFIWAYLGIFLKHVSASEWNRAYPLLLYSSASISILLIILFIFKITFWRAS